jgi:hypothetical protein
MNRIFDIIKSEIPIGFFHEWLPSLNLAYKDASNIVKSNCEPPEAHNMLPYLYNAKAEEHLRRIASKYPCFRIDQAQLENGYNIVILRTDSMIITQKSIQSPGSMIDPSPTRKTLALGNARYCNDYSMPLFAIDSMTSDKGSNRIYGILTHNRASVFSSDSAPFANIAYPDPSFKYYIENVDINEYLESAKILQVIENPIIEINDEAIPKLKIGSIKEKVQ